MNLASHVKPVLCGTGSIIWIEWEQYSRDPKMGPKTKATISISEIKTWDPTNLHMLLNLQMLNCRLYCLVSSHLCELGLSKCL